ncbi:hypothetical protein [Streptomyces wuyuanensis]|uniref:hypothetical protein n=1 Tax=Streptomyces wuyuanensis TaxID=1196353 RepID=UPI00379FB172
MIARPRKVCAAPPGPGAQIRPRFGTGLGDVVAAVALIVRPAVTTRLIDRH